MTDEVKCIRCGDTWPKTGAWAHLPITETVCDACHYPLVTDTRDKDVVQAIFMAIAQEWSDAEWDDAQRAYDAAIEAGMRPSASVR